MPLGALLYLCYNCYIYIDRRVKISYIRHDGGGSIADETVSFLSKAKLLVSQNKRRIAGRTDFVQNLALIGITSIHEIWPHILSLKAQQRIPDSKLIYDGGGEAIIFIKKINGHDTYIKLKIEENNDREILVCISFHKLRNQRGE